MPEPFDRTCTDFATFVMRSGPEPLLRISTPPSTSRISSRPEPVGDLDVAADVGDVERAGAVLRAQSSRRRARRRLARSVAQVERADVPDLEVAAAVLNVERQIARHLDDEVERLLRSSSFQSRFSGMSASIWIVPPRSSAMSFTSSSAPRDDARAVPRTVTSRAPFRPSMRSEPARPMTSIRSARETGMVAYRGAV